MDCPMTAKYQPVLACLSAPHQHRILQYLAHLAARPYTGLTLTAIVRAPRGGQAQASCQHEPSQTQAAAA